MFVVNDFKILKKDIYPKIDNLQSTKKNIVIHSYVNKRLNKRQVKTLTR